MSLDFGGKGIDKSLKILLESEKCGCVLFSVFVEIKKIEIIKLVSRCLEHVDAGDRISKLFKNLRKSVLYPSFV